MHFQIISRRDEISSELQRKMIERLKDAGMKLHEESPELVISIGGDGTLLSAFHKYQHRLKETCFVGVHTGHLGFYADWNPEEIDELIDLIIKENFELIEYPLVETKVICTGKTHEFLSLNESTLKMPRGTTLVIDVNLRKGLFERFRGDGICISTPSGSTAYNKSLGGAIIHPSFRAMQLTEIASINNRVFRTVGSPMVFPDTHLVRITTTTEAPHAVTVDHLHFEIYGIEEIEYRVAAETIRFARFRPFPFWQRVRESFISN